MLRLQWIVDGSQVTVAGSFDLQRLQQGTVLSAGNEASLDGDIYVLTNTTNYKSRTGTVHD